MHFSPAFCAPFTFLSRRGNMRAEGNTNVTEQTANARPETRTMATGTTPAASVRAVVVSGVVVMLAALALFGLLGEDVANHTPIPGDAGANVALHRHATPALDAVMNAITALGATPVLTVIVLVAAVALLWRRRVREAAFLLIVGVGSAALTDLLKRAFARPRPALPWALTLDSYSYPSGHALGSLACYVALAVVVWRVWGRRWGAVAVGGAALLVLAIGFSRVYLGVHYVSDVIGGYAAATCWVSGAATATAGWRAFPHRPAPGGETGN